MKLTLKVGKLDGSQDRVIAVVTTGGKVMFALTSNEARDLAVALVAAANELKPVS